MAFPSNPTNGQSATRFGRRYQYNSTTGQWRGVQSVASNTIVDLVDSDYIAARVTASGTGVTAYSTLAELPLADNTTGAQAFVAENNRLYLWNGTGWYNIALINTAPTITSGADAAYVFAVDGTPTVITLEASDAEGFPITWSYSVTSGSLGTTATVSQADNVFTITPSTNVQDVGEFTITFTASDGLNLTTATSVFALSFTIPAEILLVGGGGAGGVGSWTGSGGGGGGGVIHDTSAILYPGTTYPIVVGAGAAGYPDKDSYSELQGQSSEAFGYTALGGGTGGQFPNSGAQDVPSNYAQTGGSGGGGTGIPSMTGLYTGTYENIYHQQGAAGTPSLFPAGNTTAVSYQNSGGYGRQYPDSSYRYGGGGGGAGTPGGNASVQDAGDGGDGVAISITGSAVYYGGGGGGGRRSAPGTSGTGGLGGGGNAESPGVNGLGGGGGGINSSDQVINNSGGSGVVIIRTMATATATTGNPTITTDGSYNIYKFLTNGSITF